VLLVPVLPGRPTRLGRSPPAERLPALGALESAPVGLAVPAVLASPMPVRPLPPTGRLTGLATGAESRLAPFAAAARWALAARTPSRTGPTAFRTCPVAHC
jgi:hypothetical protein